MTKLHLKLLPFITVIVGLVTTLLLGITSFGWFSNYKYKSTSIDAEFNIDYFNGGDGSYEHPFEIDNPLQYYHFVWLQDMGYFNREVNGEIYQVAFKVTSDLDMSEYILPPAGTTVYPFVGKFDGGGHTISQEPFDSLIVIFDPFNPPEEDGE